MAKIERAYIVTSNNDCPIQLQRIIIGFDMTVSEFQVELQNEFGLGTAHNAIFKAWFTRSLGSIDGRAIYPKSSEIGWASHVYVYEAATIPNKRIMLRNPNPSVPLMGRYVMLTDDDDEFRRTLIAEEKRFVARSACWHSWDKEKHETYAFVSATETIEAVKKLIGD